MAEEQHDNYEVVGNEVMPLPVIVYGRSTCEDTQAVRERLKGFRIPFVEVNIDEDPAAMRFVERINHGERRTPTIVFGKDTLIIVKPTFHELDQALMRAGYEI